MELLSAFSDEEFNAFNRMSAIDEFNFTQQLQFFSFPLENDEGFRFINPSSFCHFPGAENGGLSHRIVDWSSPTFPTTAMGYSSVNVVQDSSENVKKRPLVLKDAQRVHKRAQNSKNNRKISVDGNGGGSNTDGLDGLISCSSGDDNSDSNASQALNLNAKTISSRGAATDPQSFYARKRRERINERLRILHNLVPNGTKVDISTMLEEAVHYVKFLQLQIKLLSSDDLWMYAPIAYNGIEIDLDKISKFV